MNANLKELIAALPVGPEEAVRNEADGAQEQLRQIFADLSRRRGAAGLTPSPLDYGRVIDSSHTRVSRILGSPVVFGCAHQETACYRDKFAGRTQNRSSPWLPSRRGGKTRAGAGQSAGDPSPPGRRDSGSAPFRRSAHARAGECGCSV